VHNRAEKDKKKAATEFCRARKEAIQAYNSLISHLREGGSLPEDFTKVTSDDMDIHGNILRVVVPKCSTENHANRLRIHDD
jgi:hypothetical protein